MAKSFWRRHILIIAIIVVALSVGIVFGSIPYLPVANVPHRSLTKIQTVVVGSGDQSQPGVNELLLPGLVTTESFYVGVNVTGGSAIFCAIRDTPFYNWLYTPTPRGPFPMNFCIGNTPTQQTSGAIIEFLPPNQGSYFVVALNTASSTISVSFLPA